MPLRFRTATRLLGVPWVYNLWQAPFVEAKLAPLREHGAFDGLRRVLDVGCGPGTNCRHFGHADYLGVDLDPRYVSYARRRFGRRFEVADVTEPSVAARLGSFDFVLVNSLLHHLDDRGVHRLLGSLERVTDPGGRVHIIDHVLADEGLIARSLARADRGGYPRPLAAWHNLVQKHLQIDLFHPFSVGVCGVILWELVYIQAYARG